MTKKVKKKRLNIKRTIFFLLLLYIIGYLFYYFINQPIKHIEISGNELVKDSEIITLAKLKDYPSIFKYSNKRIERNIRKHILIDDVDVKKRLNFTISISVKENKMLFYYLSSNKIVLSDGNIIKNNIDKVYGIPTLINEVDDKIFSKFINEYSKISINIIYEINEIYYSPNINEEGKIIENDMFKIIMNDGNTILTNSKNVDLLNKYNDIYASLGDRKGTINLDSGEVNNLVFIPYEE